MMPIIRVVAVLLLAAHGSISPAQEFPNRPVRIVVSWPPGGAGK